MLFLNSTKGSQLATLRIVDETVGEIITAYFVDYNHAEHVSFVKVVLVELSAASHVLGVETQSQCTCYLCA